ncbi:nucleoporin Nup186/Nup192/Nup205 [Xylariomycetidae sp. FL2044]|nr:nucleoporin Nup186/Nup192/Nup205 [Xylariomycetidae sp. FL2044]
MADDGIMEALRALLRDLTTTSELLKQKSDDEDGDARGVSALARIAQSPLLEILADKFRGLLDKPPRKKESRDAVLSGKAHIADQEWTLNKEFQDIVLQVADELDLDELEAAMLCLQAETEEAALGRPRKESAIIRFHQQRQLLLSCILSLLELAKEEEELLVNGLTDDVAGLSQYVSDIILRENRPGAPNSTSKPRFVLACTSAMQGIRTWLDKLAEYQNSAAVLGRASDPQFQEIFEFSRISLIQQHEVLSVILCFAIEKTIALEDDFVDFLRLLKATQKYDATTVHLIPVLGTFITVFGSTEGSGSVEQARKLNEIVYQHTENDTRQLPYLNAATRAWWIAEYSGWYMEDAAGSALPNIDIEKEDKERAAHFVEALKDGAFDFLLAVAADVTTSEWQDSSRKELRQWLQNRTPYLPHGNVPFSMPLQDQLAAKLEVFVDAFISNMPDVLRTLKKEEDEQRQAIQGVQQDLDLERFLLIIAYTCEGRPELANAFWSDPESNLAGFLQWASRRSTTPLQIVFCDMLQSLADSEENATYAHEFLLDEGHQLRKSSITWTHIQKEIQYFANQIREKPVSSQPNAPRGGRFANEPTEMEPETAMLHESYLKLITKLATQSEAARQYLFKDSLLKLLFEVISSLVTPRVRAYAFQALGALLCRKNKEQNFHMWDYLECCLTGYFISPASTRIMASSPVPPPSSFYMEALFSEMSHHLDEASAFIQFLVVLTSLPDGLSRLNDALPFPENLGVSTRTRPGIEPHVDFTLGHMFSMRVQDAQDVAQQRVLRFRCMDFALTCISSFNEDLIVFSTETNLSIDSAIETKDLESYVMLHPFARVMEWMYDSRFIKSLLDTIHQSTADIGKATADSPLMLGVLRAIDTVSRALDLQPTYLDLVRPLMRSQPRNPSRSIFTPTSNGAFGSIEDGLMTSMTLLSDLGSYCGVGNPDLTLASLRLLEKIAASPRAISAWESGPPNQGQRNKAIVALDEHGDAEAVAATFIAEFSTPLDFTRQTESSDYQIKACVLDFLYSCIRATPNRPTIAHLLLGFRCGPATLHIEPRTSFDQRSSLFHALLPVVIEVPVKDEEGVMRTWLINLKYKVMRILKLLWSSPLSAGIVLDELRENDFLFHILLQGLVAQPSPIWDGCEANDPDFLATPAAQGYVDYLSIRAMALEYTTHELCSVSQGQTPALKRRVFDALGGQVIVEGMEPIQVPSVFELKDSLPQESLFIASPPDLKAYADVDLRTCLEEDDDGIPVYNINKVQEIILLKRKEADKSRQVALPQDISAMDAEEANLVSYVVYLNRLTQVKSYSLKLLKAWAKLLMVMADCNDFRGTNKVAFNLQTLQAMMPSLERYGTENPSAAYELAKLAKVLLYRLDFATMTSADKESRAVENLMSDKLFQLLQICLKAISKWVGNHELRAIYYSICYRHLTGLVDNGIGVGSGVRKTARTIQVFGEKLLNVVCDDAFCGDAACQSAALILLSTLVQLAKQENDNYVVEALNKLNFISILVDSLRDVLQEWVAINRTGNPEQHHYLNAKLALLLQLCQTREGAKYVLHANLFRTIEQSGLFAVDPELQVGSADARALEKHYTLLVKVARIVGAAIVSRGSHNVLQGRRFLTDHRMLVMHVLKRSVGIGAGVGKIDPVLMERIEELAEVFMVMVTATGFLEFEGEALPEERKTRAPVLFH